jgi:protein-S-isoprenylcysteine O-methyltransferase Ste14
VRHRPRDVMLDHPDIRVPPPLLYLSVLGIALLLQEVAPLPLLPPAETRPVAVVCLAGCAVLALWGVSRFRRARTSVLPIRPATTLITDGPFRFSRNPLYLSLALLYLGITLWLGVLWPIVLLPALIFLVQQLVILREEAYLEGRFGDAYRAYRARVRRWL